MGESDGDLIVLVSEECDDQRARNAYRDVWTALEPLALGRPKPGGVFSEPTALSEIMLSFGKATEGINLYAKRLLLLLESQPVRGDEAFRDALDQLVTLYARTYVEEDSTKEWTFLLNDLVRYFRSICVSYQSDFENDAGKWPLRNVKLRHSRVVMYAGLLVLLGEASKERSHKVSWLRERLMMTPLERLAYAYAENQDWSFHRLLGLYDVFLSRLSTPQVRRELNVEPGPDRYRGRFKNRVYADLKANSDGVMAELLRFVLSRRGSWSDRFFEYLVF